MFETNASLAKGYAADPFSANDRAAPLESARGPQDRRGIVGRSAALRAVLQEVDQVAGSDATVLVTGESGTGKELIAGAIHAGSRRRERATGQGQLRGHAGEPDRERAVRPRARCLHRRNAQARRPLRAGRRRHAVSGRGRRAAARAAGQAAARAAGRRVRAGRQLPHPPRRRSRGRGDQPGARRAGARGRVPRGPLLPPERVPDPAAAAARARRGHSCSWSRRFVQRFATAAWGAASSRCRRTSLQLLQAYPWPGNVRELHNVVERAAVAARDGRLDFARALRVNSVPQPVAAGTTAARILTIMELEQIERANLLLALETTGWRISGENGAARLLDINPSTLASRIKALGLRRPHTGDTRDRPAPTAARSGSAGRPQQRTP